LIDLKIFQINFSDINGGAARAAYRIHHAVRAAGVDSTMLVSLAESGDWTTRGPESRFGRLMARIRPHAATLPRAFLRTENPIIHSPAVVPSGWPRRLNRSDADVIHLHWVAGEMLSISDIGRLQKPVVWTLHDMWAFCGAEHYTHDYRWREGYRRENRPGYESGFDLNRWTWNRKRKYWRQSMHIVTPSTWLAGCVRESTLMCDWPVTVVPNPIDTDRWKPLDQALARSLLGLPADVPLLLFGAMGGGRDPRKGFDLLLDALAHLRGEREDLHLVVFGELAPRQPLRIGFPIHYTGHLHDDLSLRALYSAADLLVIPSRQDNLPNTGVEAHACGTPVLAFDTGGLPDIVEHKRTGYLARAFDTRDLAQGIAWVLAERRIGRLGEQARARAVSQFGSMSVADQYLAVYEATLESGQVMR
jgi:glycosyltransferase involved in cell wall biosynthesis